ncbi:MAG: group I intron-associated PD-(D/E)XK endonuclease [Patescibacteria group bacterium]
MDTKLKADIAESAVVTELLRRGFKVLKPVGDRLPYDIAVDLNGKLIRIQIKHAWFVPANNYFAVDVRRTKTNRRVMRRERYNNEDFDLAIVYIDQGPVFYVIPVEIFVRYGSTIALVEVEKRQRKPIAAAYRERWDLLSSWAARSVTSGAIPVKFGEALSL